MAASTRGKPVSPGDAFHELVFGPPSPKAGRREGVTVVLRDWPLGDLEKEERGYGTGSLLRL